MISVSLSDIIEAINLEEGKHYQEIDLVSKETDDLVLKYAHIFGLDKTKGYCFLYNKHRNLQNKVIEGFRIIGEIRTDRDFVNSPFCSVEDRAITHAEKDFGFAKELFGMMGAKVTYGSTKDDVPVALSELSEAAYLEEDYDEISTNISSALEFLYNVRGSPHNEYGKLKTRQEWDNSK